MIKRFFAVRVQPDSIDTALLLMRLVMGLAFMMHGWGKIQHPFEWMPPGSPVPGVFQFLAAFSEFGGGLALILGLLTRLAAVGIVITMLVAASMHAFVMHDPFVKMGTDGGSFEPALFYMVVALFWVMNGPGKFSIDKLIFGARADLR